MTKAQRIAQHGKEYYDWLYSQDFEEVQIETALKDSLLLLQRYETEINKVFQHTHETKEFNRTRRKNLALRYRILETEVDALARLYWRNKEKWDRGDETVFISARLGGKGSVPSW